MNNDSKQLIFVDESGDLELEIDKPGASNLFISVAVIVNSNNLHDAEDSLLRISNTFFRGEPIKSSLVGKRYKRRLKILREILNIDFTFLALVVRKRCIYKDSGLRFKPSFYKYFNRKLFMKLAFSGMALHVISDRFKGNRFFLEFKKYVDSRVLPEIDIDLSHEFDSSANRPLIQLADFVAGTLSFCLDTDKMNEYSEAFRELLKEKELLVDIWPHEECHSSWPLEITKSPFDLQIREKSINRVINTLEELKTDDAEDSKIQHDILSELLATEIRSIYNNKRVFRSRKELLNMIGQEDIQSRAFSAKVIGPIRDKGVLLTGTRKGYKIATSLYDIQEDIKDDATKIIPMIKRIILIADRIKILTENKLDILNTHGDKILINIIRTYKRIIERAIE